jgi:hypothetical protein
VALTKINGEPVRLVKALSELREGMIVWGLCRGCGGKHRGILSGTFSHPMDGDKCFVWSPNAHPEKGLGCIRAVNVTNGRVYLVIDPDITEVRRQVVRKPKERIR